MNIYDDNFFYQEAAESIVDSILSLMKQGIKSFESYEMWPYNIQISDQADDYTHVNWNFKIGRSEERTLSEIKYDIIGSAGRDCFDEPAIDIGIVIPKGRHQGKVEIDRAELFDVVSHELHHIAQNIDNNTYCRKVPYKGKLSYLLDPYEIEAFHIGTRAHAKLSGKSFEEIAKDYITRTWPGASEDDVEKVYIAWRDTDFPAFRQNSKL